VHSYANYVGRIDRMHVVQKMLQVVRAQQLNLHKCKSMFASLSADNQRESRGVLHEVVGDSYLRGYRVKRVKLGIY